MTLAIRDLPHSQSLDRPALQAVRGGFRSLKDLGPVANVQVNVNQDIRQNQVVNVAALNNVGVIGADLGPLGLNVSPTQRGAAAVAF
ncbi:MAG TPA: hypothetical protein VFF03_00030 [Rhodocyclaceae bacterium]|nr:hypothetical protein [Rhodocyclaceae bacterium]